MLRTAVEVGGVGGVRQGSSSRACSREADDGRADQYDLEDPHLENYHRRVGAHRRRAPAAFTSGVHPRRFGYRSNRSVDAGQFDKLPQIHYRQAQRGNGTAPDVAGARVKCCRLKPRQVASTTDSHALAMKEFDVDVSWLPLPGLDVPAEHSRVPYPLINYQYPPCRVPS